MRSKKDICKSYLRVLLGTAIMAFAIKCIYDPVGLVTGGVSGLAIIVKNMGMALTGQEIPLWLTTTVLNIPLFLAAIYIQGMKPVFKTLFATASLSVFLAFIPSWTVVENDLFLGAVFGGVLSGAGFGLVLGGQATTGGTDLLAALIRRRMKHFSVAQLLQVLDGLIVLGGAAVFGLNYAMYAMIAVFFVSKVSDMIIEGWKFSKQALIITDRTQEIAERLMKELDRGVTSLYARGMYSQQEREVLFCVVSKKEIVRLKELVGEMDPKAFVIVSDVREVLGEGFIELAQ